MLVLTREEKESIILGPAEGRIEVTIMDVCGGKVRLGIEAPKSVSVHRKEIQMLIDKEKGIADGTITNLSSQAH